MGKYIHRISVFVLVLYNETRSVVFCKSWPFFFLAMSIIAVIRNGHCQKYWEKIHRGTLYNKNEIAVAENVFSRPFRNNSGWSDDIYHCDKLVIFSCFILFQHKSHYQEIWKYPNVVNPLTTSHISYWSIIMLRLSIK